MNKHITIPLLCLTTVSLLSACGKNGETRIEAGDYRAIAYVTAPASENWRWIGVDGDTVISEVDTRYVTHINFAFGMIEAYQYQEGQEGRPLMEGEIASKEAYKNPSDGKYHYRAVVDGWIEEMGQKVNGEKYLHALVKLKEKKPELKVLLSIGGWNSDGFCYMSQTASGRAEFIESCVELIDAYGLDGIDIDWEYPSNGGWGEIASCESCVKDGCSLLQEFRVSLDQKYGEREKLLTIASGVPWINTETFPVLDYMNVMCYDYNPGSEESQASMDYMQNQASTHAAMVGDTKENRRKINVGVPFYNGGGPYLVPYWKEWDGIIDASAEITAEKMNWVKANGFGGGFYWAYSMDKYEQDTKNPEDSENKILQRTLYETLHGK